MLLALVFLVILAIFTASLLLASRRAGESLRVEARFSLLQSATPSGLSTAAAIDLLKKLPVFSGPLAVLLLRLNLASKLERLSQQASKPITPTSFMLRCMLCGGAGLLLALLVLPNLPVVLLVSAASGYLPIAHLQFLRKRRLAAFNKALPDLIDMMARSLRAGHALVAAIGIIAAQAPEPARAEFAEVFRQQNFGLPLRDALMQMLGRVPSNDLRVLITGILVQKETGGNLIQILDRTSAVIRERLKLQGDIRVHTAQGRFTGWILCLLPVVMMILINMANPGYSKALTDNPFGRKLLYFGIGLLVVGACMIRRIVNSIEI